MAEAGGEEVAEVVGLELLVGDVDVELGDLERAVEGGEAVEDREQPLRGREVPAEVALEPDAAQRNLFLGLLLGLFLGLFLSPFLGPFPGLFLGPSLDEQPQRLLVGVLVGGVRAAGLKDAIIIEI